MLHYSEKVELVEHVALASRKVYDLLMQSTQYDKTAVFMGRDATPVQRGVEFLNRTRGTTLNISGLDISSKLLRENWHEYEPQSKGKGHFITRLNAGAITKREMRKSLFFQYLEQEGLIERGRITLVDNGINGTLLNRLNRMLHIADSSLVIHNVMLYYSGEIPVDNLTVVLEDARDYMKPNLPRAKQGMDFFMKCVDQGRKNKQLESWPHPYASASHFYLEDKRVMIAHEPNALETITDWEANISVNKALLKKLKVILDK